MRRKTHVWASLLLAAALPLLRATPGEAHAVGLSRGEYRSDGSDVRVDLVFARKELAAAVPALDSDADGDLTTNEVASARVALAPWVEGGVAVRTSAGASCAGRFERAALTEQDGLDVAVVFHCPDRATGFSVRFTRFDDLSLGHRHLVTAASESKAINAVLYAGEPELASADRSSDVAGGKRSTADSSDVAGQLKAVAPSLFLLGIEHILTGYDHLLFLLALVLVAGSWRSILGAVTAFTLAHSVTLGIAALGIWTPRSTFVEPAIALSIAYVGIENCIALDLRRRWRLTFLFGLIHGFGFAGALQEVAVSAAQLPLALASFNLGVEAGQLAVLAIVLPMVWLLAARPWFARAGVQLGSVAISAMGLWWFVERITAG